LALIAFPAVLMALVLTASPWRTLLLHPTRPAALMGAVLLAVCLNPAASALGRLVQTLYPVSPDTIRLLEGFKGLIDSAPLWQVLALIAFLPAVCEELAFRGFILSGLRHLGNKGMAILVSSLFFGMVHGMLQQSISACILGLILGFLAVHTGSLLPCMFFHATHNGLQIVSAAVLTGGLLQRHPALGWLLVETEAHDPSAGLMFRLPVVIASLLASGLALRWFCSLPLSLSPEERLRDALDHQSAATA
jgi:sodium transport system permease protein